MTCQATSLENLHVLSSRQPPPGPGSHAPAFWPRPTPPRVPVDFLPQFLGPWPGPSAAQPGSNTAGTSPCPLLQGPAPARRVGLLLTNVPLSPTELHCATVPSSVVLGISFSIRILLHHSGLLTRWLPCWDSLGWLLSRSFSSFKSGQSSVFSEIPGILPLIHYGANSAKWRALTGIYQDNLNLQWPLWGTEMQTKLLFIPLVS